MTDPKLTVIQGDVKVAADVDKVISTAGNDLTGVIVALGGKTKDVGPTMLTEGTTNIVNSMKKLSKAKRIAVVTSIGAGDSEKQAPIFFKGKKKMRQEEDEASREHDVSSGLMEADLSIPSVVCF